MQNESYDLAVDYVLQEIADQMAGDDAIPGTRVEVEHMENCDCVPVLIGSEGSWDLVGVRQIVRGGESSLRAIYEAR